MLELVVLLQISGGARGTISYVFLQKFRMVRRFRPAARLFFRKSFVPETKMCCSLCTEHRAFSAQECISRRSVPELLFQKWTLKGCQAEIKIPGNCLWPHRFSKTSRGNGGGKRAELDPREESRTRRRKPSDPAPALLVRRRSRWRVGTHCGLQCASFDGLRHLARRGARCCLACACLRVCMYSLDAHAHVLCVPQLTPA